jgi:ATP-dependent DNA helicase RecG
MGYDQFRISFLSQNKQSPHLLTIKIPDSIPAYYGGVSRDVGDSCKKVLSQINETACPDVKDYTKIKTGGKDGWSCVPRSELVSGAGEAVVSFLRRYLEKEELLFTALKWYGRGLRLDLAIKKVLLEDETLFPKMMVGKSFLVGGFLKYSPETQLYSVLNPPVISSDKESFSSYYIQYGSVKGLTDEQYRKGVENGLSRISSLDFIPPSILSSMHLPSTKEAARMMHHPNSYREIKMAKERGVFDDLTYLALRLKLSSNGRSDTKGVVMKDFHLMHEYVSSLPFPLTSDQKAAVNCVCKGMVSGKSVDALIQGDVGTGKTAVAFCLILIAAASGYQAALAAPYTTLALQHYNEIKEVADRLGLHAVLFTSELKKKERERILEEIKSGKADIVVGTHSIFGSAVEYGKLGLIITDEEHKFGVIHRENFREKAVKGFHQVTMSATPIPKTLASTIYGDVVEVISILEKPAKRIPVQTAVCKYDKTAMDFIRKEVANGHQAYVVCPSIEPGVQKKADGRKVPSIEEKEAVYRKYLEPFGVSIAVVTGKLKAAQKNEIMTRFKNGEIDLLMATTVIEVGINVPNATVMVITGADRFGFSTLHQLRGRVGRGKEKSYCILQSEEDNEKLQYLCSTTDGFEIAQKDLELRGPGSLFGERQSGDNYYISLMMANQELYAKIRPMAEKLCKDGTGKDIVRRYEELFLPEEKK